MSDELWVVSDEFGRRLFGVLEKFFHQTKHPSVWLKILSRKGRKNPTLRVPFTKRFSVFPITVNRVPSSD